MLAPDAVAGVANGDPDPAGFETRHDFDRAAFGSRVHRIENQVQKDLNQFVVHHTNRRDALGVSREEAYEAALWSNLVTAWRIAPPVDTPSWETMNEPLPEGLAAFIRGVEGHEAAVAGWIANDALAVYPSVNLSTIRWADYDGNTSRKSAFALAEIYSPEERKVTLAHGSDDWSRVWVNGEEVLSNAQSRICLVDQDRAEVTLRAGNNRILVHCANISNAWEFTLSIVENGEGLKVALPEVAGQQP